MIHQEMDIDHEWVFLPDSRFLDVNQDAEKKFPNIPETNLVFLKNYFEEQPSNNPRTRRIPQQVVPISFPLELEKQDPNPSTIITEKIKESDFRSDEADKEVKSPQVSFRKPNYNNNESVDMTKILDSPKSSSKVSIPQIDAVGTFDFDDKSEGLDQKKDLVEKQVETQKEEVNSEGLNFWKWSLTGVGAICSFGVAAATFCIIVLGSQHRHKQRQQNQKILFQRYTDDKRMKQAIHHATKFNEAISTVRGVPIARAHITFGGYYDDGL